MSIDQNLPDRATVRRRAVVALLTAGAVGAAASGCGGGAGASEASARADKEQAGLDFARCMREHGVNVPDPKPVGGGGMRFSMRVDAGNEAKARRAQAACDHFLRGAMNSPSKADQQKMLEAALKWASCMRQNGVDVPDPKPVGSGGPMKVGPGPKLNPKDPAFRRADAKCRSLLPGGPSHDEAGAPGAASGEKGPGFSVQSGPGG
jgi:hypothetical protein